MTSDEMEALSDEIARENNDPCRFDDANDFQFGLAWDSTRDKNGLPAPMAPHGRMRSGKAAPRTTKRPEFGRLRFQPHVFSPQAGAGSQAFLLSCILRQALRPFPDLWADRPSLICVGLPEGAVIDRASAAIRRMFTPLDRRTVERGKTDDIVGTFVIQVKNRDQTPSREARLKRLEGLTQELREHSAYVRRIVLLVEHGADLPSEIARLCDHSVSVLAPDRRHLAAACRVLLAIRPDAMLLDNLMAVPFGEMDLILRPHTREDQLRQILARRGSVIGRKSASAALTPISLDTLPGMGEATIWGRELARDLQDWRNGVISWSEVDRGILLHGKPGTGKTSFARALATSCAVPLIATSLSQWQSTGHLGDLLSAMRKSFAEAREKAPSILFLDELDSLGSRAEFAEEHRSYSTQVVNSLLECLDGVDGREGVIVVGACNNPSAVDPAVLRAGRLDRIVEIPLPDLEARIAILRFHLGPDAERLANAFGTGCHSLTLVAERLPGASGADIERLVRDARRVARRARRSIEVDDLLNLTPAPIRLSEEERYRFAIHEIGHALAVVTLSSDHLDAVWMCGDGRRSLGEDGILAAARSLPSLRAVHTLDHLETELVKLLAGTAAESVLLGSRSTGASGTDYSDLARATQIAAKIELHHGLGTILAAVTSENQTEIRQLLQRDKDLRARVDMRLKAAFGRAERLIRDTADIVGLLVRELMEQGELAGDRVREVVASRYNHDP